MMLFFLRAGLIHRFRYGKPEDCGLPTIPFKFVARKMLKEGYSQGYGRHTKEECLLDIDLNIAIC